MQIFDFTLHHRFNECGAQDSVMTSLRGTYGNPVMTLPMKKTKNELTTLCRRATPKEWAKYSLASLVINCLNKQDSPALPKAKLERDDILH